MLMAWGVEKLTFVDAGKVATSNPARQPLYEWADRGRPKAEAAAAALRRIAPHVQAEGHVLHIPMPGHPAAYSEQVCEAFDSLVRDHEIVLLGTDSREGRWLPTLCAAAHGKRLLNAAIGFDSFLVQRCNFDEPAARLGCYFCSDVVGVGDSSRDRAMDEQCTVTRPGVAALASSLACELLAQWTLSSDTSIDSLPHAIRGFLGRWNLIQVSQPALPECVACGPAVLKVCSYSHFAVVLRV
jgi:ubiquitin-like modifier-activating enzyme ATG7